MTNPRLGRTASAVILSFLAALAVHAHSTVKRTDPASGSILAASPAAVVLELNEPARLTSVVVVLADRPERKLEFTPAGSSTTFTIDRPELAPGRNEIRWKALSKDGHPVGGSIILVIKPAPAPKPKSTDRPGAPR